MNVFVTEDRADRDTDEKSNRDGRCDAMSNRPFISVPIHCQFNHRPRPSRSIIPRFVRSFSAQSPLSPVAQATTTTTKTIDDPYDGKQPRLSCDHFSWPVDRFSAISSAWSRFLWSTVTSSGERDDGNDFGRRFHISLERVDDFFIRRTSPIFSFCTRGGAPYEEFNFWRVICGRRRKGSPLAAVSDYLHRHHHYPVAKRSLVGGQLVIEAGGA